MKNNRYDNILNEINRIFGDDIIYLVGGACRDLIMGKEPKDFDFVTPLSPDQIEMYIQRAGRAGRRRDSAGFTISLALLKSHDLNYFNNPIEMINGYI